MIDIKVEYPDLPDLTHAQDAARMALELGDRNLYDEIIGLISRVIMVQTKVTYTMPIEQYNSSAPGTMVIT